MTSKNAMVDVFLRETTAALLNKNGVNTRTAASLNTKTVAKQALTGARGPRYVNLPDIVVTIKMIHGVKVKEDVSLLMRNVAHPEKNTVNGLIAVFLNTKTVVNTAIISTTNGVS